MPNKQQTALSANLSHNILYIYFAAAMCVQLCGLVVYWLGVGLRHKRLRVRLPAIPLTGNNLGQVVRTRVSLSPSSIICYRSRGGDALQLGR